MKVSRRDLMMLQGFSEKQDIFTSFIENTHESRITSRIDDSKEYLLKILPLQHP